MNRQEVISAIEKYRLITIARGLSEQELLDTAEAMYAGGVRLMEVTYDACGEPSDEEIARRISSLARRFEGRMFIGAGTVLTARQVELTHAAGGQFIISPDFSAEVIEKTRELGMVSIPGAFTPTECMTAHRLGADFIKIFPTSEVKPSYFAALRAPLSQIKYLAVGGVNTDNVHEFLKAGVCGIGVASGIINKKAIKAGDWAAITAYAHSYTDILTKE